jgi:hypothetical protein
MKNHNIFWSGGYTHNLSSGNRRFEAKRRRFRLSNRISSSLLSILNSVQDCKKMGLTLVNGRHWWVREGKRILNGLDAGVAKIADPRCRNLSRKFWGFCNLKEMAFLRENPSAARESAAAGKAFKAAQGWHPTRPYKTLNFSGQDRAGNEQITHGQPG